MLEINPLPILSDNYLWLLHQPESEWLIAIDPGDAQPAIEFANKNNKKITAILVTHRHWDHTDGINELVKHFNCPVYGPGSEHIPQVTHAVSEGEQICLHGIHFDVIEIPGHTQEHIAYTCTLDGILRLFSGDTLFSAGCGRLLGGTAEQLKQSLDRIKALPDNTKIYCTHEYTAANLKFAQHLMPDNLHVQNKITACLNASCTLPTTVAEEKLINPFLRCNDNSIKKELDTKYSKTFVTEQEVFSYLRQWKDHF